MNHSVDKTSVLETIDAERAHWDSLLAEVGEERMDEVGVTEDWSFKDMAAHITAWRQRSLDRLEAAARGEPDPASPVDPDSGTEDRMNADFYEANRDRPLQDVLQQSRETFTRLRDIVNQFSTEDLNDPGRVPWMDGEALGPAIVNGSYFSHLHEGHEPDIRAWLERRS